MGTKKQDKKNQEEKTTSKDWLRMDLDSQSGSIWVNSEKRILKNDKKESRKSKI